MHNLYNIRYAFRIERRQKIKSEVKIEFEIHTAKTKSRTAKSKPWRKHLVIVAQIDFLFPVGLEGTGFEVEILQVTKVH